jgi:formate dehydrogenase major subunit
MVIGANPTDGHPVFASRVKKRLREGAKLIVVDPRIDLVRTPHIEASYHLPLMPGTNVAVLTAMAHVIVTDGLVNESFAGSRCDMEAFTEWAAFVAEPRHSPEAVAQYTGVAPEDIRAAARLYATGGNDAIYYGLGVTEHSQGSTTVLAIANLAMATGNLGRPGVGVNPLRGQNNVQGACDMGSSRTSSPAIVTSPTMRRVRCSKSCGSGRSRLMWRPAAPISTRWRGLRSRDCRAIANAVLGPLLRLHGFHGVHRHRMTCR